MKCLEFERSGSKERKDKCCEMGNEQSADGKMTSGLFVMSTRKKLKLLKNGSTSKSGFEICKVKGN
jgi:hypothetical protein